MKRLYYYSTYTTCILFLLLILSSSVMAQSGLDCSVCHATNDNIWMTSHHADTQNDVADELAGEWSGLPADSVILGQDAENCIACHSPLAITANSGMTEVEALEYFFSTSSGLFSSSTQSLNNADWPHVACETCHNVPADHPTTLPTLALYNSSNAEYTEFGNSSELCGQCHGSLRFPDTDHLRFDAWKMSLHGRRGQADVAGELGEAWSGSTPEQVAAEENCIACHAPTAVLANGGMTETEALNTFFTTEGGVFSEATTPSDTTQWPNVSCTACHNPMHPDSLMYFNSTSKVYESMDNAQELCGQCHGNLRFPNTDHLSYNIAEGTGGVGIPDTLTMPGIQCVDCHMHSSDVDGSKSSMLAGHSWSISTEEEDGSIIASCTSCHSTFNAEVSENIIKLWQSDFAELDSIAHLKIAEADSFMIGRIDSLSAAYLEEAKQNLAFAESDESGGVHNHLYSMALLNDAVSKSNSVLTGIREIPSGVAGHFSLSQNYPNPFNSETTILFHIAQTGHYVLKLYNVAGQNVMTLLSKDLTPKNYRIQLNANSISSGVYYYELLGKNQKEIKKLVLIK